MNESTHRGLGRVTLALLGLALCTLAFSWAWRERNELDALVQQNRSLERRQAEETAAFFGGPLSTSPRRPDFVAATERRLATLKGRRGGGSRGRIKGYASATAMFAEIMTAIDEARPAVSPDFTSFELDPELNPIAKSTIRFEIESVEPVQRIIDALDTHCELLRVKSHSSRRLRDGGYEVTIDLAFRPGQLPAAKLGRRKRPR